MTAKQRSLYFRTWARVKKALTTLGEFSPAEAEAQRHEYHIAALGKDKSSNAFTNADLDRVLDKFEETLVLLDGPRSGSRTVDQPIKRLIHAISGLGLEDSYLDSIAADQFHVSGWRNLSLPQLTRFRYTATARSRSRHPAH